MRRLVFAVVWLVLGAFRAAADLSGLERVQVSGSDYVRVEDWARHAGLSYSWTKRPTDVVSVSGQSGRVYMNTDSRKVEISGVAAWLSLPVVNRSGVALVSALDLEGTIEPILHPKHSPGKLQTICLDPGHGGKDKGKVDGHNFEKDYSLRLAEEVARLLKAAGFNVVLTRDSDRSVELTERGETARHGAADLFVSLHYNSAPTRDIRGVETYCMTPPGVASSNEGGGRSPHLRAAGNTHDPQNALLAWQLQKAITTHTALQDRGVKRARFEVLREATVPAVLIEGGFMSNTADSKDIYDLTFRKQMAQAIVDGLLAYKRAITPALTTVVPKEPTPHTDFAKATAAPIVAPATNSVK